MTKKAKKKKLWSGRSSTETHALVDELNASIFFDKRLYKHDIFGSKVHAQVLQKAGILTKTEMKKIHVGLNKVQKEIEKGELEFTVEMEDIHMAVETRLTEIIGPLGGKLHTGRSRNDQVATDIRLYLKDEILQVQVLIIDLISSILQLAMKHTETIIPGYTHLQRAQTVLFSHHLLTYYAMLSRDCERFGEVLKRTDMSPLGAGALAGSPYDLDREFAAEKLGFKSVIRHSMDAVSDRDFIIEFISASSILMMHLSRLSEELILWSSSEFDFIELSDAFTTGSSIMPQKKNPDIPELVRGKTGRVYGNLTAMLTVMKALPLAYNKDMQEDKEPLFDTLDTVKAVLGVFSPMVSSIKINDGNMLLATQEGFLTATDVADHLANKGIPFRDAYAISGRIVADSIKKDQTLEDLTLEEWQKYSDKFDEGIITTVKPSTSVDSRKVQGGTATVEVKKRLKDANLDLKKLVKKLQRP